MNGNPPRNPEGAIAVVGMSCRFPGAADYGAFWSNLVNGIDSIERFTRDAALADGADPNIVRHPSFVAAGGVLEDAICFDNALFGYSPREALAMDPQQRVLLECAWSVLEDAGCCPELFPGRIGVFAGTTISTYLLSNLQRAAAWQTLEAREDALYGNFPGFPATRISYKLNLKGPSVNIQTACSTSLVAVHTACQSLLNFECDMALAGGATVRLPQRGGYIYEPEGIRSPDGYCRVFDSDAQGTVFGNGVGMVALKRLDDAIADRDRIDAVILGSATNNDGSEKAGYTAPSIQGQADVIAMALRVADVAVDDVGYIEAHGTGTALGDPIEIAALGKVFDQTSQRAKSCALGSVKANVGHLDAAAGICGLIKSVLMVRHGFIPPVPHFNRANPRMALDDTPFFINGKGQSWPSSHGTRIAGVSAFGFGGTNCHVVLSDWVPPPRRPDDGAARLFVLSAHSPDALEAMSTRLGAALDATDESPSLADVAATLQTGRTALQLRKVCVARKVGDVSASLSREEGVVARPARSGLGSVFMFPGQGSQHAGMAAGLYSESSLFRKTVDHCIDVLRSELGLDLLKLLFPAQADAARADELLLQTRYAQPALFVVEYALAEWWTSLGVEPDAMIGHSIGEYVAACRAGIFSLSDALRLVAIRGRLMNEMAPGAMLAVPLAARSLSLPAQVEIAAINARDLCVVSGPIEAIERYHKTLEREGIQGRRLHTSHAFHSASMDGALERFGDAVSAVKKTAPKKRFTSNVTGDWITDEQATDANYWVEQTRRTVDFSGGVERILRDKPAAFIEVGPGTTLTALARAHLPPEDQRFAIATLPRPNSNSDATEHALLAAGRFWCLGGAIDWRALQSEPNRVALPSYPFEQRPFYVRPDLSDTTTSHSLHKRADMESWSYVPAWTSIPSARPSGPPSEDDAWLIFADANGIGDGILRRVGAHRANSRIAIVTEGRGFERLGNGRYTIPAGDPHAFEQMFAGVVEDIGMPNRIVVLWGAGALPTTSASVSDGLAQVAKEQDRGLFLLLDLGRMLSERPSSQRIRLIVATAGTAIVTGDEAVAPGRTTALGLCRVIPEEIENVSTRFVDLPAAALETPDLFAEHVFDECLAEDTYQSIAYRGRRRWSQNVVELPIDASDSTPARLRNNGTYLITGGFGGIGLTLAKSLAQGYKANLILIGRQPLPPRNLWSDIAAAESNAPRLRAVLAALQAIEADGGRVLALEGDVSDPQALRRAIEAAREEFGRVDGVIHAAGSAGGGVVALQTRDTMWDAMKAKMVGAISLVDAFSDDPPDFILFCSSLAALVGTAGRADYTAANLFMDALAHAAHAQGRTEVVSVNWDLWVGTGMAATGSSGVVANIDTSEGLTPDEGVEMFRRILGRTQPQVMVSVRDLPALLRQGVRRTDPDPVTEIGVTANEQTSRRNHITAPFVEPRNDMERALAEAWQETLGIGEIGIDDNYFELGGDSLMALRLASRLRQRMGIEVGPKLILETLTVSALARAIATADSKRDTQRSFDREDDVRKRIDEMTPEQIRAMLAEKKAALRDG